MADQSTAANFMLRYLPIIVVTAGVIVSATTAQVQIGINSDNIAANKASFTSGLNGKVSSFLYDRDLKEVKDDLIILAGNVETNEELVEQVEDAAKEINSNTELEFERLRNQLQTSEREQDAKLETILRLLEQQAEDQN